MRLLIIVLLTLFSIDSSADEMTARDTEGNEIDVTVYPSDTNLLIIWLVDHEEERITFEKLLSSVHRSGAEIWRVDLLDAYFLPRGSENQRTLSGDGVAALLRAAHKLHDKSILLVAYDRIPLSLLRGVRLWQEESSISRLAGVVLFYPNLFGPSPTAGEDPVIDPIVEATNIPVVIYQPEIGSQRWRLMQIMESLWKGGSPAFAYMVPGVRDWFFMGETPPNPSEEEATGLIPQQLQHLASLLETLPKPMAAVASVNADNPVAQAMELVPFQQGVRSPGFNLPALNNGIDDWNNYQGKVTLVNFWATWCPPCVEEIPSLNRLSQRYHNKDFEVVSIDFRETEQELEKFTKSIPVDFPVLIDQDGKTALQWKVFSFPSTFIIDRNGFIRYSANLAIDWDTQEIRQVIDQLLAE